MTTPLPSLELLVPIPEAFGIHPALPIFAQIPALMFSAVRQTIMNGAPTKMSMHKILRYLTIELLLGAPLLLHAASLTNPLATTEVSTVIGRLIQALLGITGAIALLMFIWGGFQWLISGGSPEKVKKGKETLIWAVIGLAVIVGAYMLVSAVVSALESGTLA